MEVSSQFHALIALLQVDMAAKADACTRGKSSFCRQASSRVL